MLDMKKMRKNQKNDDEEHKGNGGRKIKEMGREDGKGKCKCSESDSENEWLCKVCSDSYKENLSTMHSA